MLPGLNSRAGNEKQRHHCAEKGETVMRKQKLDRPAILWYNVDANQPGDEMVSTGEAGLELQAEAPGPRKNWAKSQVPNSAQTLLWLSPRKR